jgi:hypothetical protein
MFDQPRELTAGGTVVDDGDELRLLRTRNYPRSIEQSKASLPVATPPLFGHRSLLR